MSRHLMAKMQRSAGDTEGLPNWREESSPHDDWRQYHPGLGREDSISMEWRPPYARGESHVSYSIRHWPGSSDGRWFLTHNGLYRGPYHHEDAVGRTYSGPDYHRKEDGSPRAAHGDLGIAGTGTFSIGQFPTYEAAQAAASAHFDKNYRDGESPSYHLDHEVRDYGDDYDFGDIFGGQS